MRARSESLHIIGRHTSIHRSRSADAAGDSSADEGGVDNNFNTGRTNTRESFMMALSHSVEKNKKVNAAMNDRDTNALSSSPSWMLNRTPIRGGSVVQVPSAIKRRETENATLSLSAQKPTAPAQTNNSSTSGVGENASGKSDHPQQAVVDSSLTAPAAADNNNNNDDEDAAHYYEVIPPRARPQFPGRTDCCASLLSTTRNSGGNTRGGSARGRRATRRALMPGVHHGFLSQNLQSCVRAHGTVWRHHVVAAEGDAAFERMIRGALFRAPDEQLCELLPRVFACKKRRHGDQDNGGLLVSEDAGPDASLPANSAISVDAAIALLRKQLTKHRRRRQQLDKGTSSSSSSSDSSDDDTSSSSGGSSSDSDRAEEDKDRQEQQQQQSSDDSNSDAEHDRAVAVGNKPRHGKPAAASSPAGSSLLQQEPNAMVVTLRAGLPGNEESLRVVITTCCVLDREPFHVDLSSIFRAFDDERWCDPASFAGVPLPSLLTPSHSLPSDAPSSASSSSCCSPSSLLRQLMGVRPIPRRVDRPTMVLDKWPKESYHHGIGPNVRQQSSNNNPVRVSYPQRAIRLQNCAALNGELEVVAGPNGVPYGTAFVYGGVVATPKKPSSSKKGNAAAAVAAQQRLKQQADDDDDNVADEPDQQLTDIVGSDPVDTEKFVYSYEVGSDRVLLGHSVARYINHKLNFAPSGNVQFVNLTLEHDATPTGAPPQEEQLETVATSAVTRRKHHGKGGYHRPRGGAATGAGSSSAPAKTTTVIPFFLVSRDVAPGDALLADSYGSNYDSEMERFVACNDQPMSAVSVSAMRREKIRREIRQHRQRQISLLSAARQSRSSSSAWMMTMGMTGMSPTAAATGTINNNNNNNTAQVVTSVAPSSCSPEQQHDDGQQKKHPLIDVSSGYNACYRAAIDRDSIVACRTSSAGGDDDDAGSNDDDVALYYVHVACWGDMRPPLQSTNNDDFFDFDEAERLQDQAQQHQQYQQQQEAGSSSSAAVAKNAFIHTSRLRRYFAATNLQQHAGIDDNDDDIILFDDGNNHQAHDCYGPQQHLLRESVGVIHPKPESQQLHRWNVNSSPNASGSFYSTTHTEHSPGVADGANGGCSPLLPPASASPPGHTLAKQTTAQDCAASGEESEAATAAVTAQRQQQQQRKQLQQQLECVRDCRANPRFILAERLVEYTQLTDQQRKALDAVTSDSNASTSSSAPCRMFVRESSPAKLFKKDQANVAPRCVVLDAAQCVQCLNHRDGEWPIEFDSNETTDGRPLQAVAFTASERVLKYNSYCTDDANLEDSALFPLLRRMEKKVRL